MNASFEIRYLQVTKKVKKLKDGEISQVNKKQVINCCLRSGSLATGSDAASVYNLFFFFLALSFCQQMIGSRNVMDLSSKMFIIQP